MKETNVIITLVFAGMFAARVVADDFSTTTAPVRRAGAELVTPVNQIVTPAGMQVELRGIRPNALALRLTCMSQRGNVAHARRRCATDADFADSPPWEITGFIASDGFEWVFEQVNLPDELAAMLAEVGLRP